MRGSGLGSAAEEQQRKQTKLYNRKVKGEPVYVGDMLANKCEGGERNQQIGGMAQFTVISKNDTIYTYKYKSRV